MLSSQRLCPRSCRISVAFIGSPRLGSAAQQITFNSLRKTFVVAAFRDGARLTFNLVAGIAHRDAKARPLEHRHVVRLVADRRDVVVRYPERGCEVIGHETLVRV